MLSNARALLILEQTEISQHSSFLIHLRTGQPKDADVPNSVLYVFCFLCAFRHTKRPDTTFSAVLTSAYSVLSCFMITKQLADVSMLALTCLLYALNTCPVVTHGVVTLLLCEEGKFSSEGKEVSTTCLDGFDRSREQVVAMVR